MIFLRVPPNVAPVKLSHKFLVILIALPIALFIVLELRNFITVLSDQRDGITYILPDGFKGWAILEHRKDCPDSITDDGKIVYNFDAEGYLCTSTRAPKGWGNDLIARSDDPTTNLLDHPSSPGNKIWHDRTLFIPTKAGKPVRDFFVFFVGESKLPDKVFADSLKALNNHLFEIPAGQPAHD